MKARTLQMTLLPVGVAVLVALAACDRKEERPESSRTAEYPEVTTPADAPDAFPQDETPALPEPATPEVTPPPETPSAQAQPDAAQTAPATAPAAPAGGPATAPRTAAQGSSAPAAAGTTAGVGSAEAAQIYKTSCSTCHGAEGRGDGVAAAALNPKPSNFATGEFKYDANGNGKRGEVEDIKAIIRDGTAKHGGSPLMAPWPMLSDAQQQAVAEYVKGLHVN